MAPTHRINQSSYLQVDSERHVTSSSKLTVANFSAANRARRAKPDVAPNGPYNTLPPELYLKIMEEVADVKTLRSLAYVCGTTRSVYQQYAHSLIRQVVRNAARPETDETALSMYACIDAHFDDGPTTQKSSDPSAYLGGYVAPCDRILHTSKRQRGRVSKEPFRILIRLVNLFTQVDEITDTCKEQVLGRPSWLFPTYSGTYWPEVMQTIRAVIWRCMLYAESVQCLKETEDSESYHILKLHMKDICDSLSAEQCRWFWDVWCLFIQHRRWLERLRMERSRSVQARAALRLVDQAVTRPV